MCNSFQVNVKPCNIDLCDMHLYRDQTCLFMLHLEEEVVHLEHLPSDLVIVNALKHNV